jgi:hypothetical protein
MVIFEHYFYNNSTPFWQQFSTILTKIQHHFDNNSAIVQHYFGRCCFCLRHWGHCTIWTLVTSIINRKCVHNIFPIIQDSAIILRAACIILLGAALSQREHAALGVVWARVVNVGVQVAATQVKCSSTCLIPVLWITPPLTSHLGNDGGVEGMGAQVLVIRHLIMLPLEKPQS